MRTKQEPDLPLIVARAGYGNGRSTLKEAGTRFHKADLRLYGWTQSTGGAKYPACFAGAARLKMLKQII
jgi:hypothetical protein